MILNQCTNIPGISPKDLSKISHLQPKIISGDEQTNNEQTITASLRVDEPTVTG